MIRCFLSHYMRGNTDLNKIGFPLFNSIAHFPLGMPANRKRIARFKHTLYSKTHEKASNLYGQFIERAIYIIRNPIDIVPSFSRHMGINIDRAIHGISRENTLKGTAKIYPQKIGSWSTNVLSWLSQKEFPILYIRYESIVGWDSYSYRLILEHFGTNIDETKLADSLAFVRFSNLKEIEKTTAFKEARGSTGKFFNYGKPGGGKETLSPEQVRRVIKNHGYAMAMLGYSVNEQDYIKETVCGEGEDTKEIRLQDSIQPKQGESIDPATQDSGKSLLEK